MLFRHRKSDKRRYKQNQFMMFAFVAFILGGCSSAGTSSVIDSLFGSASTAPVLSAVPAQVIQQKQTLKVDINNVRTSTTGDDKDMSYTCLWTRVTGGSATTTADCSTLPNGTASFGASTGILTWTPSTSEIGQFKIMVTGTSAGGSDERDFTVDVRLAFAGLESLTGVQGDRMTLNWTANPSAVGYQVLRKNSDGTYSIYQTITDPTQSSVTITNLVPLTNYSLRVMAIDSLGSLDGNTVTLSAITADLIRLEVTASATQLSPGQSTSVTVKLKDNAGNYLTTSGLSIGVALSGSGTSSGTFSAVSDLGNGVYTAVFTATSPGTANAITANLPQFYYVERTAPMQVMPLQVEIQASQTTLNPNKTLTLTARIRDFNGVLMSQGGQGLAFTLSGGTSTATISAATDLGTGTFTATMTGQMAGTAVTVGATLSTSATIYSTVTVQVVPYSIEVTSTLTDLSLTRSTTVTARVKDWQGNYLTTGGQGLQFAITGSTGILTLGSTTDNNNGTYTATITGLSLGTVVVTATMTPSYSVAQTSTVTVRKLRLEIIAGASHLMPTQTTTLTGRVKDWQGNLVGVGGEGFDFSASGGTSTGTVGAIVDNGNGTYSSTFTASTAGTALTVSGSISDTFQVDTTSSITVEKWRVYVTTSATTVQTGQAVLATVTVKDYLDTQATTGGQQVSFAFSGGTSTASVGTITDNSNGTYTASLTGVSTGTAITVSASMSQSYQVIQTASLTVGSIYLAITTAQTQMNPGGTTYVYAQVQDSLGNALTSGSYSISFSYSGGTSTGSFSAVTYLGNGRYRSTFTAATGGTALTVTASATSAYSVASTASVQVVPWSLKITASSTAVTVGQTVSLTGKVYDYLGNAVTTGGQGFAMAMATTGIGTLSSVSDNSDGTYSATFSATGVGSTSINGTITSSYTLTSTVTLVSTAVHLSLSATQSSLNPGDGVVVTAVVKDASGTSLLSNAYTIGFSYSGGTSTGSLGSTVNLGTGAYTSTFTGNVAGTATTITAYASVPFVVDQTVNLTVVPWNVIITASKSSYSIYETGLITAIVKDWSGTQVTTGGKGLSLSLSSSGVGSISATTDNSDGSYAANFQATSVGSVSVAANMSQSFTVSSTPTLTVGQVYLYVTVGSGASSASVASGSTVVATITLKNSSGTTVTGTGYSINTAVSGGSSTLMPTTSVSQVSAGVYQITYQGVLAGTATTISASTNVTYASSATAAVTVTPSTTISTTNSTLAISSSTVRSGSTVTVTATMKDAAGNLIPSLSDVAFANTSGSGIGTVSFAATTNVGSGVYMSVVTGGTQGASPTQITVSSGGTTVGTSVGLTVTSGVASALTVAGPTSATAGSCSTAYSLSFYDSAGNATTLSSATSFVIGGLTYGSLYSDSSCSIPITTVDVSSGAASSNSFYLKTYYPATYALTFTASGITQSNTVSTVVAPVLSWLGAAGVLDAYGSGTPYGTGFFDGSFNQNQGLTYYNDGTDSYLFASDSSNHSVQKIKITSLSAISVTGALGRVNYPKGVPTGGTNSGYCTGLSSSTGVNGAFCTGGQYTSGSGDAQFNGPFRTTTMKIGGVNYAFITDNNNGRIMKYNADTGAFIGWTGYTSAATTSCLNGTTATTNTTAAGPTTGFCLGGTPVNNPTTAYVSGATSNGNVFRSPTYITNDGTYLYIYDSGYNRIVMLDPSSGLLVRWMGRLASTGVGGVSGTGNSLSCLSTQSDGSAAADGYFTPSWCVGGYATGSALAQGSSSNIYLNPQWSSVRSIGFYSDGTYNWMSITDSSTSRVTRYFCGASSTTPNCNSTSTVSITTAGSTASHGPGEYFGWTGYVGSTPTNSGGAIPASINSTTFFTNTQNSNTSVYTAGWAYYGTSNGINGQGSAYAPYGALVVGTNAYIASVTSNRIDRLNLLTGVFTGWIGRISATPSAGVSGCAGANAGSVTPGWCYGGSSTAGSMLGGFGTPIDVTTDGTYLFVADRDNYRISIHLLSTGAAVGTIGLRLNSQPTTWSTTPYALGTVMPTSTALNTWFTVRDRVFQAPDQMTIYGDYMYVSDSSNNRIKRYKWLDGTYAGWVGLTYSLSPTGGDDACVGALVGGFTPGWCQGGGFTNTSAFGFSNPKGLASDGTYLYVADTSNHRIVKVRLSDGTFMGWIGYIGTAPSDGDAGCSSASAGSVTPGWCLGGAAAATSAYQLGGFSSPWGLAGFTDTDNKYYLIVGDYGNNRLQKIDVSSPTNATWIGYSASAVAGCAVAAGTITSAWCNVSGVASSTSNTATPYAENGSINQPRGIYIDTSTTPIYAYVTSNAGRVERFNASTGAFGGWIGLVGTAGTTGAAQNCLTGSQTASTVTPSWCHGGTPVAASSTSTVGQLSATLGGVYVDSTYLYVSDTANNRIQKWNKSTGAYVGWVGRVLSTPSGGTGCTSLATGAITPTWCTGGIAKAGYLFDTTNLKSAFDTPTGVYGKGAYLYILDSVNGRLISMPSN